MLVIKYRFAVVYLMGVIITALVAIEVVLLLINGFYIATSVSATVYVIIELCYFAAVLFQDLTFSLYIRKISEDSTALLS